MKSDILPDVPLLDDAIIKSQSGRYVGDEPLFISNGRAEVFCGHSDSSRASNGHTPNL